MINIISISILILGSVLSSDLNQVDQRCTSDHQVSIVNRVPQVTNFHSQKTGNRIFIQWKVESNQAASLFEIEKSSDGKNFTIAALVFGTESEEKSSYWFYDRNQKRVSYYRIKTISKTGEISYSPVIKK